MKRVYHSSLYSQKFTINCLINNSNHSYGILIARVHFSVLHNQGKKEGKKVLVYLNSQQTKCISSPLSLDHQSCRHKAK